MTIVKMGSPGIPVYIGEKTVRKVGPKTAIEEQYGAYLRLQRLLGEYNHDFPKVLGMTCDGNKATLTLERLFGDNDLEEYVLTTKDEASRVELITKAILSALGLLEKWQTITTDENPLLLLEEIRQSIEFSYQQLGRTELLDLGKLMDLLGQESTQLHLIAGVKLGPCHRDFCTSNIWPAINGNVRVFDPLWSFTGSEVTSSGHVVLDIVDLYINIERLQSDRIKNGLKHSLPLRLIDERIQQWLSERRFSEELLQLALLRRYLDFASCRCDHCLAQERRHRFALMEKRAGETENKLITRLRAIKRRFVNDREKKGGENTHP